jgi:hypothetical protein
LTLGLNLYAMIPSAIVWFSLAGALGLGGASHRAISTAAFMPPPPQQEKPHAFPAPGESPEDADRRSQHPETSAPDRISIVTPIGDVLLGNPVHIVVKLAPGKVTTMQYRQGQGHEGLASGVAKVVAESDGSKTIEVVPLSLGVVDVAISAIYLDNAEAEQAVQLNVVPTARGLKKFDLDQGSDYLGLVVDGKEYERVRYLRPTLRYENAGIVHLNDFSHINLSAIQDESDPVIQIDDKSGAVTALREGEAYIVGDFCGVKDKIHVVVKTEESRTP